MARPVSALHRLRAFWRKVEPWYNWGPASISSVKDEAEGEGRYFEIDWLGLHVSILYGRTPTSRGPQ